MVEVYSELSSICFLSWLRYYSMLALHDHPVLEMVSLLFLELYQLLQYSYDCSSVMSVHPEGGGSARDTRVSLTSVDIDEPMAPQIIDTENYYVNSNKSIGDFSKSSGIRFGGFYLVEKYIKRNKGICASDVPPSSILSIEAHLHQKQEMKSRRFIHIGRVAVEINEA